MVQKVRFSPDGRELITVSEDKTIRFWDAVSGEPLRTLHPPIGRGAAGSLLALAISPDGGRMAVGGVGLPHDVGRIVLVALPAGEIVRVLHGHETALFDLAFSPDGRLLASAGGDHSARVWEVESGRASGVLEGRSGEVCTGVAFSPDGRRLVTAGLDGGCRMWDIAGATPQGARSTPIPRGPWPGAPTAAGSPPPAAIARFVCSAPRGRRFTRSPAWATTRFSVAFHPASDRLLITTGGRVRQIGTVYLWCRRPRAVAAPRPRECRAERHVLARRPAGGHRGRRRP